ncbi:MAG: NAD(P)H-hydrate dehydratase [Acetatifactor sp.]|nr:NAD(P)H-hydrate dehydratase [Acetatifactor sp.]
MRYLVTAEEMKRYDANSINQLGVPGMVLMERAALSAREVVLDRLGVAKAGSSFIKSVDDAAAVRVLIMAGVGNNGGDGLALGRLLGELGCQVEIWLVGDKAKASDQWRSQWKILQAYDIMCSDTPAFTEYTILVDALFGVGLSREVGGLYREAVERFNQLQGYKLALDVPSGIDSDTGTVLGCAVRADETVTFGFCKRGLVLYPGCEYAGKVVVGEIGINERSFLGEPPGMFCLDSLTEWLPARDPYGNKSTFGKVLLVAGSDKMAGAAVLAARAAYRSGAGMVKVVTDASNREILQGAVPEALFGVYADLADSLSWADVIVIGSGLGQEKGARKCLAQVLTDSNCPLVIDADGLNLLAADDRLWELVVTRTSAHGRQVTRQVVLTPHVGELSRLTGVDIPKLKKNLAFHGLELSRRLGAIVVAKDARTFVCCQGKPVCVNLWGNSGMATAGSGDVLAGILGGLLAQSQTCQESAFETVCLGVGVHAQAGDMAAREKGEHGCMAGDIAEAVAAVLRNKKRI